PRRSDAEHRAGDHEVDDEPGRVDEGADEGVGEHCRVRPDRARDHRHDASDGRGHGAHGEQRRTDHQPDGRFVDQCGEDAAEDPQERAEEEAGAQLSGQDLPHVAGRTSPRASARVTVVAAWLPVFPPVPIRSGTNSASTVTCSSVSSKIDRTCTVNVAPTASTSSQTMRELTSVLTGVAKYGRRSGSEPPWRSEASLIS